MAAVRATRKSRRVCRGLSQRKDRSVRAGGGTRFYIREELLDLVPTDRLGSLQVAEELGGRLFRPHSDIR